MTTPETAIVAIEGDSNASSIGITKVTFDRLLREEKFVELFALYGFYCYTARFQNTTLIYCADSFAAKALNRSREHVQKMRSLLEKMKLVGLEKKINKETGKVERFYIRVRYLVSRKDVSIVQEPCDRRSHPPCDRRSQPCDPIHCDPRSHKTEDIRNINALELAEAKNHQDEVEKENEREEAIKAQPGFALESESESATPTKKRFSIPSVEEVEGFMLTIGLNGTAKSEAQRFWDHHAQGGWILKNGRKMVDWHAAVRTWKSNGERFGTIHAFPASTPKLPAPRPTPEKFREFLMSSAKPEAALRLNPSWEVASDLVRSAYWQWEKTGTYNR